MGILDTIINTKQAQNWQNFKPADLVRDLLGNLKERDRQILIHRYGLDNKEIKTLAAIGQEHGLTRERVRQIEKDILKHLKKHGGENENFNQAKEFLLNIIAEHGRVIAEENLLIYLNLSDEVERNAVIFLLNLIEELDRFIHENFKSSWVTVLFNEQILQGFSGESKKIFETADQPLQAEEFLNHFKQTQFYQEHQGELDDRIILNFLELAVDTEKNVFGAWGLAKWKEIKPKDVGDKAYVVIKNHKKPEHYAVITEMINKAGFDHRVAYKETVHNELIKDPRFVLVGRGIYALKEWGYKSGVVADVIKEVLAEAGEPLSREKIIEEVGKRRLVKKNTILVGLSNKKLFKKTGKNSYAPV